MALTERWMPGAEPTADNLGTAKWLEDEYWKRMEIAVSNGIAVALKG
ncbi:hypothetical protein A584_16278 [Pseudomonas syringae pv. theae ICMP 3923]|nr:MULTISPECIES: hypothetical protein [Pseudomonas syringae group]EPM68878.1 hypothetical protein A584_16278 [Pseudomonas syringae pv. theae ICMP 3923]RMO87036.1 hypothetical protein ALQ32_00995 [Pseudomonas syringae pv. tagetis]GKQ28331.1 hypothetical protein PSTH68_02450 [Pseudomonas syringae pv. theae]